MKKIYSIFITLTLMVVASILPATAQQATVSVSYRETFNNFSYTGQKTSGSTIHAIGGGTATVNVSNVSVPTNAKLDSIIVYMAGVSAPEKKLTAAGSTTFSIADVSSVTSYTVTATLYYTQGENHANRAFTGNNTITVYPLPVMPTAETGSAAVYERGDKATISRSVSEAKGGNSNGWQYNWTITTKDNSVTANTETLSGASLSYTLNSSFSSDTKTKRDVAFAVEVVNMSPVGNEEWVKTSFTNFAGVTVYNTPSHQPSKLGHFTDAETNQDFYVAMNLGMTDAMISTGGYEFNFINGSDVEKTSSRKLDNAKDHKTYTNVFVQWIYDETHKYPASAPSQVEVAELSIDYKYTSVTFEPHSSYAKDDRYLKTPVFHNNTYHYFTRSNVTLRHEVNGIGFDIENGNVKTRLSYLEGDEWKDKVEGSKKPTGSEEDTSYTWRTLQAGEHKYYLIVSGKLRVESAVYVTMDINGKYSSSDKIQIWDLPTPAEVSSPNVSCTDIESEDMVLNVSKEPGAGVPENWKYEWSRALYDKELEAYTSYKVLSNGINCVDDESMNDDSTEKNFREFGYFLNYKNLAPDNKTAWFEETLEAGQKIIYNAPDAPQSLLYVYTDKSRPDIAAANIGLSDDQLDSRKYKFYYPSEPQNNQIQDSRYYNGNSDPEVVVCLWKYTPEEDNAPAAFDAYSEEAYKTIANLGESFEVETSTKEEDGQNIDGYLGAVRNDNDIYAFTGSQNRLKIQVSDNYVLEKASITINGGSEQEAEREGNSAYLTFCPQDEEIAQYTFGAKIDYAVIVDRYTDNNGQTQYEYLGNQGDALTQSIAPEDRLHVYPRPIIPEAKLDSVYITDYQLKDFSYSIEPATGANASGWWYDWEAGDSDFDAADRDCTVRLESLGQIDGPANEIKNVKVRALYENESPVEGQTWYRTYVDIADINVYNVPNRVRELVKYTDEANEYYIAQNLYCGDENLSRYEYKFRFFNGDDVIHEGSARSMRTSNLSVVPDKVCSYIVYPKDANHEAFEVASAPVTYAGKEVSPSFIPSVSHEPDARYNSYNFSYRQHPQLGFYDLAGKEGAKYNVTLRTEGDFYMSNGRLDNMLDAQGSPLSFIRTYTSEGEYLPKVSGDILYAAEPGISPAEGKYTTLHFDYTYPSNQTVHIYPEPVVPEEFELDNVQFRDIDPLQPMNEVVPFNPTGANASGWDYSWIFDDQDMGHNMIAEAQNIDAQVMGKQEHVFRYRWTNASPMPDDPNPNWMSREAKYNVTVYNTPQAPGTFVRKGNGTSGIYIANTLPYDDDMLKDLDYYFQFGDNDPVENNAISTEEKGRRWYQYSSPNRPWVRSVWIYDYFGSTEYTCYSNYVIAEGSRAEFTVEDIFNYEGDDMQVYTISGAALGNVRMRDLTPGLYIVEIGTGDDKFIKKIYKK